MITTLMFTLMLSTQPKPVVLYWPGDQKSCAEHAAEVVRGYLMLHPELKLGENKTVTCFSDRKGFAI